MIAISLSSFVTPTHTNPMVKLATIRSTHLLDCALNRFNVEKSELELHVEGDKETTKLILPSSTYKLGDIIKYITENKPNGTKLAIVSSDRKLESDHKEKEPTKKEPKEPTKKEPKEPTKKEPKKEPKEISSCNHEHGENEHGENEHGESGIYTRTPGAVGPQGVPGPPGPPCKPSMTPVITVLPGTSTDDNCRYVTYLMRTGDVTDPNCRYHTFTCGYDLKTNFVTSMGDMIRVTTGRPVPTLNL